MATKVLLPQFGESVVEGTITRWLKAEGETVEEYEALVEVNTDKVDTEVPSPASGVLIKILVPEGETVEAGTLLAWIGAPGESLALEDEAAISPHRAEETQAIGPVETVGSDGETRPGRSVSLGFISPVVARMAADHNLDLSQIQGTGRDGRITKKDVQLHLETRTDEGREAEQGPVMPAPIPAETARRPVPAPPPAVPAEPGQRLSLSPVRRAIADHMVHSKQTSPHVTTVMEADLGQVAAHRTAHKADFLADGANLTFTVYFVSAAVTALKTFPVVNSSWVDGEIQLHRQVNLGMATSLGEEGLIVPVIKDADSLSLLGIARTVNDLAERARDKQLAPQEVQGGTFTITNHGTSGSLFATPIINQPQCAILGVGLIQKRPVVVDDAIAIRPMVYLSLTFDHRILDGAIADYFLGHIVQTLEAWE